MKKILVIDDDTMVREVLAQILAFGHFEVITATNGIEGITLARTHLPDLILCDVTMPGLDGFQTLGRLREDPAMVGTPFIFLTAKIDKSDMREGMNLGADDYLTKPIDAEELIRVVSTRLQKKENLSRQYEQRLEDLRTSISRSLPHELRTPMSAVLSLSEWLVAHGQSMTPLELVEKVQLIHSSAKRLHGLLENFWFYAKLEILASDTEKVADLRRTSVGHARAVAADLAYAIAGRAGRSDDLEVALDNAVVRITDANLRKLLAEVLDNAFKYSSTGSRVTVSGRVEDDWYLCRIADGGRGMTPTQIAAVGAYVQFDRGFHEQQGSGLGLAIARRLAELHEGDLTIVSVPDEGTTVTIRLPIEAGGPPRTDA